MPGHHHGSAHRFQRDLGRAGDGLRHDTLESTVANLSRQETKEKPLLVSSEPREQTSEETTLFGRCTFAIYCRNAIEDRAHLGQLHESLTCRLASGVAQRSPAHPQSLWNDAAEICGGDLDFGGRNAAEKVGQEPHLVAAAARVGDSAGCFDQLGKLHDGEGLRAKR